MINQNENISIFGMRGTGKSTLCYKLQDLFPNVFIFDTLSEYDSFGYPTVTNFDDFCDFVLRSQNTNGFRLVIKLDIDDASNIELFDQFIKILYYRGNCTIVIEEIQNFASVHNIPPYLKQSSLTGRHRNVNFITTTQRIAEIHKSLLSQAHHIFSGYTDSPNDIKTLKNYGFRESDIVNVENFTFIWKNGRDFNVVNNSLNFI